MNFVFALVLDLSCFDKVLQVDCDANGKIIGEMAIQEGRSIPFFSEKLNEAQ